ncbi:hypothetical protein CYMTET_38226 [Cymbomonas tetramitiformis]|uniref:Chromo domain-containing protein n=1 Tax=Cymbomonas tetramitiformis TaxID=36881 RepID=A0AAE0F5P3_9CHLO|nr:hypothetical protein CYMTET_38226 [Cymbomonas tetramitiformis]
MGRGRGVGPKRRKPSDTDVVLVAQGKGPVKRTQKNPYDFTGSDNVTFKVREIKAEATQKGKPVWLIGWEGYDDKADTWEPIEHLAGYEQDIAAFRKSQEEEAALAAKNPQTTKQKRKRSEGGEGEVSTSGGEAEDGWIEGKAPKRIKSLCANSQDSHHIPGSTGVRICGSESVFGASTTRSTDCLLGIAFVMTRKRARTQYAGREVSRQRLAYATVPGVMPVPKGTYLERELPQHCFMEGGEDCLNDELEDTDSESVADDMEHDELCKPPQGNAFNNVDLQDYLIFPPPTPHAGVAPSSPSVDSFSEDVANKDPSLEQSLLDVLCAESGHESLGDDSVNEECFRQRLTYATVPGVMPVPKGTYLERELPQHCFMEGGEDCLNDELEDTDSESVADDMEHDELCKPPQGNAFNNVDLQDYLIFPPPTPHAGVAPSSPSVDSFSEDVANKDPSLEQSLLDVLCAESGHESLGDDSVNEECFRQRLAYATVPGVMPVPKVSTSLSAPPEC